MRFTALDIAEAIHQAEERARQAYADSDNILKPYLYNPSPRTVEQIMADNAFRTFARKRPGAMRSTPGEWWK